MIKKSDLYASLWSSCDELRGGMDASQYKDYVLTLLFMKYVSDKYAGKSDALIDVPSGGSFADMVKVKGDKEIGDKINKIIARLADANDLSGVIDVADFNDGDKLGHGKEMQDRLSKLVAIFEALDFRTNRAEGDDLLGDAYEYLMRHFATESGKSKGQFYTPAEVSRVMAKVVGVSGAKRRDQTIYDPTCGSGSLLLKAADEAPRGITIYGQEMDNATWALARMNMILHGHPEAELWRGNTLAAPYFKTEKGALKTFDFAVANPPFSSKAWTTGFDPEHDGFDRFTYGVPPIKNGDYAFLLHVIASLKSTGKAAVILPHGVVFRGNREADIRRELVKRGLIKGIIGLPANLFYGTGIPACIVVIDKEGAADRDGVFLIDASTGFVKDGNKNRLRSRDIHKIVDVFTKQLEVERYSRMVPMGEIADPKNDYNLNIPRYIDSSEPEDIQDLDAHLRGGIPERDIDALSGYWDAFPKLRAQLFKPNRAGYVHLAVDLADVQQTVLDSPEFQKFANDVRRLTDEWSAAHRSCLEAIDATTIPNELIARIGEDLLARFKPVPLLDEYDVYEQLMTYWHTVMHDDVLLVMHDGWVKAARPRPVIEDKTRKLSETADLEVGSGRAKAKYKTDLLPSALVIARYFSKERSRLDELNGEAETATHAVEEYAEEHGGDEGLLSGAVNDKGKLTVAAVRDALKEARTLADQETAECAQGAIERLQAEAEARRAAKDAQADLEAAVFRKFGELTDSEIKSLVLDDKWAATARARIVGEANTLTLALVSRIQCLGERYTATLSILDARLAELEARVKNHLSRMGVT